MAGTPRALPIFCFLSLCLSCFPSRAAEAHASETITELSREIHTQLEGLRRQSRDLTEQLLLAESELRESSLQAETLKTELAGLNSCLESTNEKLAGYSAKLTEYEAKLRESRKRVWTLGIILAAGITLFALVRAVTIFLRVRDVRLPEIANIIL